MKTELKFGERILFPESTLKEAANIQEALKPLGFEIIGFRNKYSCYEYVLHLRFTGSAVAADNRGVPANGCESNIV